MVRLDHRGAVESASLRHALQTWLATTAGWSEEMVWGFESGGPRQARKMEERTSSGTFFIGAKSLSHLSRTCV